MKFLAYTLLFLSFSSQAEEKLLNRAQSYTVPSNTIWVISNVEPASCKVCTADIYIYGEASNVEVNGVVFHGKFDFSFEKKSDIEIKVYEGTKIQLGDSRPELLIQEVVK